METIQTLTPAEISGRITEGWSRFFDRSRRRAERHPYVYASAWRECDRRMALEMTTPEAMKPFDAETLARFRRGDDRERDLLQDLARVGRDAEPSFQVIGQQEAFELRDRKGRVAIKGKVDARLKLEGVDAAKPLEVKAWSPNVVQRIEKFEDLFENPWTRSGAHQLLAYLYGAGVPYGFLLLDRSGLPMVLPVELEPHLDRMEDFLGKAERALDAIDSETLPNFYTEDANECRRCPFYGSVCNPPLLAQNAAEVLTDPDLEVKLQRREEIKAIGKEYLDLDGEIKQRLRGIESGIAGPFQIQGKWGKQSRLELPEPLKKQYTKTDPKGRFTLTITRLS